MIKKRVLFENFKRITSSQSFIPEIDFLRFIAIFAVVIYHIYGFIRVKSGNEAVFGKIFRSLVINGKLGVELFFVLSGFILSIPFASFYFGKKTSPPNLKKFYLRRITRLEPPYILTLTVLFFASVFLNKHNFIFYFKSWAASLIYLHTLIFKHNPYLNGVAWSLEIEVLFYLSFPLLARIFLFPKAERRVILLGLMTLIPFLSHIFIDVNYPVIFEYVQFFFIGMFLCDIYLTENKIILNNYLTLILTLIFLSLIFLFDWSKHIYLYITLFPVLISCLYLLVLSNSHKVSLFRNKFLVVIGGMCYSIYLIHYPIISMIGNVLLNKQIVADYPYLLMAILLFFVLAGSLFFFKIIERPFMNSKWIDKLKPSNTKNK